MVAATSKWDGQVRLEIKVGRIYHVSLIIETAIFVFILVVIVCI